jgi:hypothetical protein
VKCIAEVRFLLVSVTLFAALVVPVAAATFGSDVNNEVPAAGDGLALRRVEDGVALLDRVRARKGDPQCLLLAQVHLAPAASGGQERNQERESRDHGELRSSNPARD